MNYNAEKFLLKLYQDLEQSDSLSKADFKSGKNSANKYEKLKKYLDRLQKQEKVFDGEHEELEKYLKNRYFEKYVIKEEDIPESYWKHLQKKALERENKIIEFSDADKHIEFEKKEKAQKESLEEWIDYLLKTGANYPMWVRYWAFQGMLKIGSYDKEKGTFLRRTNKTVAPFITLNPEALAATIETLMLYVEDKMINDEQLKELIESGNFARLYGHNLWKMSEYEKQMGIDYKGNIDGKWIKFTKGQEKELVECLKRKNTKWCIFVQSTAKDYLENGDLEIFFSKDHNKEYTVPRVCINTRNGVLDEVRGVASDQNLEDEMIDIVDKKLNEYPYREKYDKKLHDAKRLCEVYNKARNNEALSFEEQDFIFELDEKINSFGWIRDQRIDELQEIVSIKDKDYALAACSKSRSIAKNLDISLRNDKDFIKDLININPYFFTYATDELKNDKEYVFDLLKINRKIIRFLNDDLLTDQEFLNQIADNDILAILYAKESVQNNEIIIQKQIDGLNNIIMSFNDIKSLEDYNDFILFEIASQSFFMINNEVRQAVLDTIEQRKKDLYSR